jgi:hypothetical protein
LARTTEEVQEILNLKRKNRRPSYFSVENYSDVPISGSTEDALILASSEAKQQAVDYLQLLLNAGASSPEHTDIMFQFIEKQEQNTNAKKAELDQILTKFNSFKTGLLKYDEVYDIAAGMAPLLKALNRGIKTLRSKSDTVSFDALFYAGAKNFFNVEMSIGDQRELRSWIRVILSYV